MIFEKPKPKVVKVEIAPEKIVQVEETEEVEEELEEEEIDQEEEVPVEIQAELTKSDLKDLQKALKKG